MCAVWGATMLDNLRRKARSLVPQFLASWQKPPPPPDLKLLVAVILGGLFLAPLVHCLPLLGYDWFMVFYPGQLAMYPPWMPLALAPLRFLPPRWSFAVVGGLTLATVAFTTYRQSSRGVLDGLFATLLALLSPPLWYLLWDGQIDGLVLLSFFLLPWSIPLVLLRPQITGWFLLSRRSWTLPMVAWLLASCLIWGPWLVRSYVLSQGSASHPTAIGWATTGWPVLVVGLAMWLTSKGHPWRVLAASILASPYVQPYHMTMLVPVLGRLHGWKRLAVWGSLWVVGLVPGLLGITKYLALILPALTWVLLRGDVQEGM